MHHELNGRDLEGNGLSAIEILARQFPGVTKESLARHDSGCSGRIGKGALPDYELTAVSALSGVSFNNGETETQKCKVRTSWSGQIIHVRLGSVQLAHCPTEVFFPETVSQVFLLSDYFKKRNLSLNTYLI
jgi:hypothetical protein